MKYILLGDLHFGIKGYNREFFENQKAFFTKQLFPYMRENGIKSIIQLGDIFDKRNSIDIAFLTEVVNFFEEAQEFEWNVIIGNHDMPYKDRYDGSLLFLLEKMLKNFKVYDGALNDKIYLKSWVIDTFNPQEIEQPVIMGHFEINDFFMTYQEKCTNGFNRDLFKDKLVFSGHFHLRNETGAINYIGTPYQLNWNDFMDRKGFYVFDDETMEYQFIENKVSKPFVKMIYDGKIKVMLYRDEIYQVNLEEFRELVKKLRKDVYLKIQVDKEGFEEFLEIVKENFEKYSFLNNIIIKIDDEEELEIKGSNEENIFYILQEKEVEEHLVKKIQEYIKRVKNEN